AEEVAPDVLRIGQHHRDEFAHLVVDLRGCGPGRRRDLGARIAPLEDDAWIEAEEQAGDDQDDGADTASGYTDRHAHAAPIFDIVALPAHLPPHDLTPFEPARSYPAIGRPCARPHLGAARKSFRIGMKHG